METIIFFATTFVFIIQAFYTHFISNKRSYFSFDDAVFTEQELVELEDSWIEILERFSIFLMFGIFLVAVVYHLYVDPVNAIWFIVSIYVIMLALLAVINYKVYRITTLNKYLWHSVWPMLGVPVIIYLMLTLGVKAVDIHFEEHAITISDERWEIQFSEIDELEMVSDEPSIPVDNRVSGIGAHLHGDYTIDDKLYTLHIEDRSSEMIRLVTNNHYRYFNSGDTALTSRWYEELKQRIE
ncbi:hypothetical protein ACFOLA_08685 [Salinicoccus hispanicus]|uniref:Uncharacterized protein n=1 Tax=Salinicoccus hispanicus TaxID=157225 RepID=A0A6N8U284_9STAP|nr:hypothetical protein [Salinicoccus hispanicus]MXQ51833.1 hypothetical protein [Salinicoccus hispanicus]